MPTIWTLPPSWMAHAHIYRGHNISRLLTWVLFYSVSLFFKQHRKSCKCNIHFYIAFIWIPIELFKIQWFSFLYQRKAQSVRYTIEWMHNCYINGEFFFFFFVKSVCLPHIRDNNVKMFASGRQSRMHSWKCTILFAFIFAPPTLCLHARMCLAQQRVHGDCAFTKMNSLALNQLQIIKYPDLGFFIWY